MRPAEGGAILAAAAALAGCAGGGDEDRGKAVNEYLTKVSVAQTDVLVRSHAIDRTLRRLSLSQPSAADLATLERTETDLRGAARQVRAVEPPPEARRLHADLLRLLELEADVTHDLLWAARYVPQLRTALEPVAPAAARLTRELRTARGLRANEAAFAAYRRTLEAVLPGLERLSAPPALRPALVGERRAVRRSIALCLRIERSLSRGDLAGLGAGVSELAGLASGRQAVRTREAEIAAAKAYNKRLAEIDKLLRQVQLDRRKIVDSLN